MENSAFGRLSVAFESPFKARNLEVGPMGGRWLWWPVGGHGGHGGWGRCHVCTLPKTNIAPETRPSQNRKLIFQPSVFRRYVSFREGIPGNQMGPPVLIGVKRPGFKRG